MTEQNKEQVLELDTEQLQELLDGSDKLPPIEIPMEFYDSDKFHQGIKDYSYVAGAITALLNVGVTESFVLDYLLNQETIKHNIDVAKINRDMNVEMSKNQKVTHEKYEL